jgi:hypothetical protein
MSTTLDHFVRRESAIVDPKRQETKKPVVNRVDSTSTVPAAEPETKPVVDDGSGFLFRLLGYDRAGERTLAPNVLKVVAHIQRNFVVPDDFDRNLKFGPLSGMSTEERLISSYEHGLLEKRSDAVNAFATMCFECGDRGHKSWDCPSKLDGL